MAVSLNNPISCSLVVPTYNEAENIIPFLQGVHAALGNRSHEVIVVDDDSPDRTGAIADEFEAGQPWVQVIHRSHERGLSSAVLAGFERAGGEYLAVMDADLSHDESILQSLLEALENGADIAVGSRRVKGGGATAWPWYRRLMSNIATGVARVLLRLPLADPMSGYFIVRRPIYELCKERLRPTGYKILVEICHRIPDASVREIPYIFKDRKQGYSKLSGKVAAEYLKMVAMLRLDNFAQWLRRRYHTGRYRKVKRWLKSGTVLDIGCGRPCETMPDGSFLRFLGFGTGLDIKRCVIPFPFVQGSILDLPFDPRTFENIVAMEVLEHVNDPRRAFSELARVLRDEGRLVISVPEESWLWEKIWSAWENTFGYMWHETHSGTMAPDKWQALLREYFVIEERRRHWYFDRIIRLRKKRR
jgi:dolichol-phosphate mannosyltransferase